jgi:hypothetical protein
MAPIRQLLLCRQDTGKQWNMPVGAVAWNDKRQAADFEYVTERRLNLRPDRIYGGKSWLKALF